MYIYIYIYIYIGLVVTAADFTFVVVVTLSKYNGIIGINPYNMCQKEGLGFSHK